MEDTKTISAIGMSHIISEFTKRVVFRALIRVEGRASRVGFRVEPEPVVL